MSEPSAKAGYYTKVKALVGKFWDPETGDGNIWIDASVNVYNISTLRLSRLAELAHPSLVRSTTPTVLEYVAVASPPQHN